MIKPNKIRELRETAACSQWDLAAQTGIDRSRVSLIECGHVEPSASELAAIEKALAAALSFRLEQVMRSREEVVNS